jgi:hypothetical protein
MSKSNHTRNEEQIVKKKGKGELTVDADPARRQTCNCKRRRTVSTAVHIVRESRSERKNEEGKKAPNLNHLPMQRAPSIKG